jgi:hypothetical protein
MGDVGMSWQDFQRRHSESLDPRLLSAPWLTVGYQRLPHSWWLMSEDTPTVQSPHGGAATGTSSDSGTSLTIHKGAVSRSASAIPFESAGAFRTRVSNLRKVLMALPQRDVVLVAHAKLLQELLGDASMLPFCGRKLMTL